MNHSLSYSRAAVLTAAGVMVALGAACSGSQGRGGYHCCGPNEDDELLPAAYADDWRSQSLSLSIKGYEFLGPLEPAHVQWVGLATWISPDLALTNAHVALRALEIVGTDDFGNEFVFDRIVAIDQGADLAIIQAASPTASSAPHLLDRPGDPRSLRGRTVRVVGTTGGLGLSLYEGRITNIKEIDQATVMLHHPPTAGRASGGLLFDAETYQLVGIAHASIPAINARAAAPSWVAQALAEKAASREGVALVEAFLLADVPVEWYVERASCLEPGQMIRGDFASMATNDVVAYVEPSPSHGSLVVALARPGEEPMALQAITGRAQGAWTLPGGGQYMFAVANPEQASSVVCATVRFGRLDWDLRLESAHAP
jgi:hypothetical protein